MSSSDNARRRRRQKSSVSSGRRTPERRTVRDEARTPDRQRPRSRTAPPRQYRDSRPMEPDRRERREPPRNSPDGYDGYRAYRDDGSRAYRDDGSRDGGTYNSCGGGRSREYREGGVSASRASRPREDGGRTMDASRAPRRTARSAADPSRRRYRGKPGKRLRRRHLLPVLLLPLLVLAAVLFTGNRLLFREPVQQTAPISPPEEEELVPFSSVSVIPEELRNLIQENPAVPEETGDIEDGVLDWDAAFPDGPDPEMEDLTQEDGQKTRKPHFFTFLLAGTDDNNGGSDTMILVGMDTKEKRITGVSLPRDTKCYVNDQARKLNFAYRSGGMKRLAKTVSWQLGIPIDYTVEVDLQGFVALVDAIGGVDFYVPIDMDYDDETQDLYIGFEQGMQHLDGKDALKVVRFRHNWDGTGYGDEDLGRMRTQQDFLKTVAKKLLTPANINKVGKFVEIFQQYVDTDLTAGNMAWLGRAAIGIGADGVDFSTLPGEWKTPYIYLDRDKVLSLLNERLNPYEEPMTAKDLHIAR